MKRRTLLLRTIFVISVVVLILLLLSLLVQRPTSLEGWLVLLGVVGAAAIGALAGFKDVLELVQMWTGQQDEAGKTAVITPPPVIDANVVIITADVAKRFWGQYATRQLSQPTADLHKATERYLEYILTRYRYLQFKGMGVSDRIPLNLPLVEMYVPLRARIEMPEGETWHRGPLQLAGRPMSIEETEGVGDLGKPAPVLDLLKEHDGLIILGDPGAGKTTFLKYLALRLARGEGEAMGLGPRLPLLLSLSAYANALAEEDIPLLDFIAAYYRDQSIDLPLQALMLEALQQGGGLLLLDGLDEVQSLRLRHLVVDRVISFFTFHRPQGNKFILTSRIVGYKEVRPNSEGLTECTLVDFEDEEIEQFVTGWTAALERAALGGQTAVAMMNAEQERDELLSAIERNPGVRQLAANPLLLTILALMKRQGVTLPERRVELYEQYVKTLIKHWNLARSLDRRHGRDVDVVETVRVLAPLALWMHQTSPGVGLVKKADMVRQLIQIYRDRGHEAPEAAAEQLLLDARDYAGLLLERGQGVYGFIHLTFQEYLAAVAIAQQGQRGWDEVAHQLARHIDDDNWHEVTLLTIGYIGLVLQWDEAAGEVLTRLIAAEQGEPGAAVVLAGEAVWDTRPNGVTPTCKTAVINALQRSLRHAQQVPPRHRVAAGRVLARLGDPRRAVIDVDAMQFCLVPQGPFWMGSDSVPQHNDKNLQEIYDSEKPRHQTTIPYDYWLGRYPVTNAQFAAFVADGGYQKAGYWPEAQAAKLWQAGQITARTWLPEKREYETITRSQPYDYGRPFNLPSYPVVGVCWYEAVAFCRWLTERWQDGAAGWQVRLPSAAEWEKGARGGLDVVEQVVIEDMEGMKTAVVPPLIPNPIPQRLYPWGDALSDEANYNGLRIGATSSVGAFATDISPYGCEEMGGNVIEWTRSLWGEWDSKKRQFKFKFTYPYDAADGREELAQGIAWVRTVKGGVWSGDENWMRCAARGWNSPYDLLRGYGIRVVRSPIFRR